MSSPETHKFGVYELNLQPFGGLPFSRPGIPSYYHSFFTRLRAALAELERSAWENMINTCMTPVTRAIPAAVNATPLHVDRSCVHLKNWMAPNRRRHAQNRVTSNDFTGRPIGLISSSNVPVAKCLSSKASFATNISLHHFETSSSDFGISLIAWRFTRTKA